MPEVAARRLYLPPGASRRLIPRWVGPLVALGLVLALVVVYGDAYWDGYQLRREIAELDREGEALRRRNAQLREVIRLLHTPEYIERIAREQLGLVRPDEIAIMLVQPTPARIAPSAAEKKPADAPWWSRLLRR
ncbi:MAG: FtsB family cell division protein [Armatimonadota bacterium]